MRIVILGLSVTSSWGNGHATTYRSLIRGLHSRGHEILFLERDTPWYADNRDQPSMPEAAIQIYSSVKALTTRFEAKVRAADLVIVGSFVPDGIMVGKWVTETARGVTAFYDIDTPVTLNKLENGNAEYLSRELVPRYNLYLSFTGGPTLRRLETCYGAPMARGLYCSVDPQLYYPEPRKPRWDLGYLGTYSSDRQPVLQRLLIDPARHWPQGRFAVIGPTYPPQIRWPRNVTRVVHLEPKLHRKFYTAQRYTLNVTRALMVAAGYSPSVRLFEAAACGTPIISDYWDGLDSLFNLDRQILVATSPEDTLRYLRDVPETTRQAIAAGGLARVLAEHTPAHRAVQLENYYREVLRNDDYVLVDSTRGNEYGRPDHQRAPAGSSPQPQRPPAGGNAGAGAGAGAAGIDLFQPSGTRYGNRPACGPGPEPQRPPVRGRQ